MGGVRPVPADVNQMSDPPWRLDPLQTIIGIHFKKKKKKKPDSGGDRPQPDEAENLEKKPNKTTSKECSEMVCSVLYFGAGICLCPGMIVCVSLNDLRRIGYAGAIILFVGPQACPITGALVWATCPVSSVEPIPGVVIHGVEIVSMCVEGGPAPSMTWLRSMNPYPSTPIIPGIPIYSIPP